MEIHHACHRRPSTPINLGPVHRDDQAFSLQLSLGMSLPVPSQDEHSPDQIEVFVHQAGLQIQWRLFRALIEKADQELVWKNRRGKAVLVSSAGGRGRSPSRRPSARSPSSGRGSARTTTAPSRSPRPGPGTYRHQLHITRNLRDAVCDQFSDRSAGESRAEVCRNAGDEDLLGLSTIIDIVHQEGEQLVRAHVSEAARSWTERPRPSWPCSAPPLPTPTP